MTKVYRFGLKITPPKVEDDLAADMLYSNGCNDALFGVAEGEYYIEFDREANTLNYAIESAISDVLKSKIGSSILTVYLQDASYCVTFCK